MDIGTGIAVLGVWMLPVAAAFSSKVYSGGLILTICIASFFTLNLMYSI
jgi:hypothetical protein